MKLVDARVRCGDVYRYQAHQMITKEGKRAYEIQEGDILPNLDLPDVNPPCRCPVVQVHCL
jgi:hypothetical protein